MSSSPAKANRMIKTATAARRLGVHPETLLRWMREGLLRGYCFRGKTPQGDRYVFDEADLVKFEAERWETVERPAEGTP